MVSQAETSIYHCQELRIKTAGSGQQTETTMASEYRSMSSSPLSVNPNPSVDLVTSPRDGMKITKGSAQLNRWSRARAVRSGRRLERPPSLKDDGSRPSSECSPRSESSGIQDFMMSEEEEEMAAWDSASAAKEIYMVSDGTGSTLEHAVDSALGQFEQCLSDRACSVNIHLFSGIEDVERLLDVIKHAAKDAALLLYTLANPSMSEAAKQACQTWGIPHVDILRPTTDAIASHLGVAPSGIPRSERKVPLSKEYFKRIEAIEFTIKQDDGALPQNLHLADIVLVGVSRTGKTPLSIYLAQKGYKVANVPIVMGVELPKSLFQIDQEKIFALSINPAVLQTIRKTRAKALGCNSELGGSYSEMDHVRHELEYACNIFAKNPLWPVLEVTGKAIEEIAAVVLRTFHDRKQKNSMPHISKRY